ncbi:MAG: biotin--[acetyl-CoA-carboxylase] ligase [Dehalococcoidia bacterium]|jgi:BirA family transcriptional regulator, biotin operon repressor / biotin---[acetyl-CoA-carboxylase] ligase|nr:biotin--[acetyl-CoA-carboxylase] ligase [Dehalococcoidia bacterium]
MPFNFKRYRELLTTQQLGTRVEYRESTSSTMDDARDLVTDEPTVEAGFACVAGQQLSGRGRLGRQWVSDPNLGLYVTFYIKPRVAPNAPMITLAAALAVAEAAQTVSGVDLEFKWPNDVMHDGKKLCGILAEARTRDGEMDVFLGIGVNRRPNPVLPPAIAAIATNLEELGGGLPSTEELLAALANALEPRLAQVDDEPQRVLDDWRAKLATLGQRVTVNLSNGPLMGVAVDLGARGELIVREENGRMHEISAGDVVIPASSG